MILCRKTTELTKVGLKSSSLSNCLSALRFMSHSRSEELLGSVFETDVADAFFHEVELNEYLANDREHEVWLPDSSGRPSATEFLEWLDEGVSRVVMRMFTLVLE